MDFLSRVLAAMLGRVQYVQGEFTPLPKPFKTKEQAEKAREKYPERLRKRIGLAEIRTKS